MPVYHHDRQDQRPAWCELESFQILRLAPGEVVSLPRQAAAAKLVVVSGAVRLTGPETRPLTAGEVAALDPTAASPTSDAGFAFTATAPETVVVHLAGRWQEPTGGCGVFTVNQVASPSDKGDPVWYPKETTLDRHYHDCDEYWIIIEGGGTVMSERQLYPVGPGDCLAIGMGHHHDFPLVTAPVRAVYFETTLEGQQRRGHLWEHTHGPAEPRWDRV